MSNSTPSSPVSPRGSELVEQLSRQKAQLVNELHKLKQQHSETVQELEKEKTKIQSIDALINQIKSLTARSNTSQETDDAEEKRALLKKLLEEKEQHAQTLLSLNEERKKFQDGRECILLLVLCLLKRHRQFIAADKGPYTSEC